LPQSACDISLPPRHVWKGFARATDGNYGHLLPTVGLLLLEQIIPWATQGFLQAYQRGNKRVHLCRLNALKRAHVQIGGFRELFLCNAALFAQQEAMLAASIDRAKGSQAERLESKLRLNGGQMTMRDLKRSGFEEAAVRRIAYESPIRFSIETVKPEKGGRESEIVKVV
jgi:hypothetical protein